MIVPMQLRVAVVLLWITGLGAGVFCLPAIRNLLIGRGIPYIMGLPTYGKGPFEHVGIPTTVPLLVAFLLVCVLEGVAGVLLWRGYKGAPFSRSRCSRQARSSGGALPCPSRRSSLSSNESDRVRLAKPHITHCEA